MNFSIFRFGFKLTFRSVYVYHLVLLIYMVLAQDNTSLTNLRRLFLRGKGVLLCGFFFQVQLLLFGVWGNVAPQKLHTKDFFSIN